MTFINKSAFMTVRVTDKTRTKFHEKATEDRNTERSAYREIVEAFVEDRLTIQPTCKPVTLKEKLYVTRSSRLKP